MKKHDQQNSSFALSKLGIALSIALCSTTNAFADGAVWVSEIAGGEVRFYDWGYTGPQGQTANQFTSNGTFDGATQIQHVITTTPDGLTPDSPNQIYGDLIQSDFIDDPLDPNDDPIYPNANMDGQVNFYGWGYTTNAGSTFSNMQIDADGDYLIKRDDMDFSYYGSFDYQNDGTTASPSADGTYDTLIGFQPYALSDATGWCGSVNPEVSSPAALEAMAGQVTFDFGFEAFFPWSPEGQVPGTGGMQIVQDFEMRSYGSLEIVTTVADGGASDFNFQADAVVNNTNPLASTIVTDNNGDEVMVTVPVLNMDGTPALDENGQPRTMTIPKKRVGESGVDENYYNQVSFMGGGIVPSGVWLKVVDPNALMSNDNIVEILDADDGEANTIWWQNAFAGYPFLLRADGIRVIDALDFDLFSDLSGIPAASFDSNGNPINLEGNVIADLSAVPVPSAIWLFGSGLLAIAGLSRRKPV